MQEKIKQLIQESRKDDLAALLETLHIDELVVLVEQLQDDELEIFFDCLDKEVAAELFVKLSKEMQTRFLSNFNDVKLQSVTDEILDENVHELLDSMPQEIVQQVLLKATPENRNDKIVEILESLEKKEFANLKPLLYALNPVDIAEIFAELPEIDLPILYRLLPKAHAAEVFIEMNSEQQEFLIKSFNDSELKGMLEELFVDDTVDLIEEMPANVVKRILVNTDNKTREAINTILQYPKDGAGSIMTTEFVSLRPYMTVSDCFDKIRRQALDKETVYTCYVIDDTRELLGVVTVKSLLMHDMNEEIHTFMLTNFMYVNTHTDKEETANILSKYGLLAVPVVDRENRLVGIVTIDDALNVLTEEATEDISFINSVTPSDKPYLETSVFKMYIHRIPWLLILMISATFTALILNTYEARLAPLILACLPMVMGTGGNAGSQASVTIIRGLSLGEVQPRDFWRVLWKETRVATIVAISVGIVCALKLYLLDNLILGYDYTFIRAIVVGISITIAVFLAKIIGACLPLIAKAIHVDPAVFANPFITTFTDILSLGVLCFVSISLFGLTR